MKKKCSGCKRTKPIVDFYAHPKTADGLMAKCKGCVKTAEKKRRDSNLEEHRRRDRQRYYEQPHRQQAARESSLAWPVEKRNASRKAWVDRNPEKRKAHVIVGNAVRDGKLKREPCGGCGAKKADAHHEDYAKPLDVRWLCKKCHGLEHRKGA